MSRKPSLSLAVFDIAGTLMLDSGVLVQSFSQAFKLNEIDASEEEIQKWRGAAKTDVIRHFVSKQLGAGSGLVEDRVKKIYSVFRKLLEENYRNGPVSPIIGAEETIDRLRNKSILVATTTGFYREVRDLVLNRLGWDGSFFDCNVCSDDVPKGRPAPYMIFDCMARLGVSDVKRVIAIGDTPLDMQAGCNAGCCGVIGVLTGAHGIETLGMARHTHIIKSVAELPVLLEKEFPDL